jgi:hypothetical protein
VTIKKNGWSTYIVIVSPTFNFLISSMIQLRALPIPT